MALRQIGFSIDEISLILNGHNIAGIFSNRKTEFEAAIHESQFQLSQISHYLERMKADFNMSYQVALKELPEVIVYSKRMVIPNYNAYFDIIPKLGEVVAYSGGYSNCVLRRGYTVHV